MENSHALFNKEQTLYKPFTKYTASGGYFLIARVISNDRDLFSGLEVWMISEIKVESHGENSIDK